MTDHITPERIAELRRLRERANELNRRDGPARMSKEWKDAIEVFRVQAAFETPALLDRIEALERELAEIEDREADAAFNERTPVMSADRFEELLRNHRARELAERVVALEDEVQRLERELAAVRSEGPLGPRKGPQS